MYVGWSKKTLKGTSPYKAEFNTTVNSDGTVIRIELNDELDGEVSLTNLKINGNEIKNQDYNRKFTEAVVWFTEQSYNDDQTTFKFGIDKKESATIENVAISIDGGSSWIDINGLEAIKAWSPYLVNNVTGTIKDVTDIRFSVNGGGATSTGCSEWTLSGTACDNVVSAYVAATCMSGTENVIDTYTTESACTGATYTWNNASCLSGGTLNGTTCDWINDAAVYHAATAPTYIEYSSSKYLDMFKIGKTEDGTRVQVGRLKNS